MNRSYSLRPLESPARRTNEVAQVITRTETVSPEPTAADQCIDEIRTAFAKSFGTFRALDLQAFRGGISNTDKMRQADAARESMIAETRAALQRATAEHGPDAGVRAAAEIGSALIDEMGDEAWTSNFQLVEDLGLTNARVFPNR